MQVFIIMATVRRPYWTWEKSLEIYFVFIENFHYFCFYSVSFFVILQVHTKINLALPDEDFEGPFFPDKKDWFSISIGPRLTSCMKDD